MKKLRILLTGGGTGGHVYPIIAVAQQIRSWAERNEVRHDIRYYGPADGYKPVFIGEKIRVVKIASSKMRRYFSLLNFLDAFKFIWGFFQGLCKIYWFMPNVAFSKGGPGALAVILACRFYRIPVVIHESDTIPGVTNKISARYAKAVELGFASAAQYFKTKAQINFTGNPVRQEFLTSMAQDQAKTALGFNAAKLLILILGGSQGAAKINDFVLENLEQLLLKYQILHQVGKEKYQEYKTQYEFVTKNFSPLLKQNYKFAEFLENNLSQALDAANFIISRAGAGAIAEIAVKGKPAILIPLPDSANGHQLKNADEYAGSGGAIMVEQENLLPNVIMGQIDKILQNADLGTKMSNAAKAFAKPEAAKQIAGHILELWK